MGALADAFLTDFGMGAVWWAWRAFKKLREEVRRRGLGPRAAQVRRGGAGWWGNSEDLHFYNSLERAIGNAYCVRHQSESDVLGGVNRECRAVARVRLRL